MKSEPHRCNVWVIGLNGLLHSLGLRTSVEWLGLDSQDLGWPLRLHGHGLGSALYTVEGCATRI